MTWPHDGWQQLILAASGVIGAAGLLWISTDWGARLVGSAWVSPELRRFVWDSRQQSQEIAARPKRTRLRLLLIRHGQSAANVNPDLVGGRDVETPLTDLGRQQATLLGQRLQREAWQFDRVMASHAVRAQNTAQLAFAPLGFPPSRIETERRVVEFSQGSLEKQPRKAVYSPDGPVMTGIRAQSMFFRPPGISPDGVQGESQYDVERRVAAFVEELLAMPLPEGKDFITVAVVSHGIAIRSFLRGVLGAGSKFCVKSMTENTSITELRYEPKEGDTGGWILARFNDAAHLSQNALPQ